MTDRFNVLISSAGRRGELIRIFQATLKDMGLEGKVIAADISPLAPAAYLADETFLVPRCTDAGFVDVMVELCDRQRVGLLVPTIDPELPVLAQHRKRFEEVGCFAHVSAPSTIEIAFRKDTTHRWLTEQGLPTVRQDKSKDVLSGTRKVEFPVIAKPVAGSASIGVARVADMEELRYVAAREEYVVQSIAPGIEYTVSVFVDAEGRACSAVPRQRLEVRAGEVSKGRTVHLQSVEELAKQVCEALPGAYGVMNVQIFHDHETDELNIIEINPRFGGGFPLAWHAGAKSPQWLIEEVLGRESTVTSAWEADLTMLRFDDAVYLHAAEIKEMGGRRA